MTGYRSSANFIDFGPGTEWGGLNQGVMRERAKDPRHKPRALRVMFAAYGWSNRIGHAAFPSGGLARILADVDASTGEMRPLTKQQVQGAITSAKKLGYISPESGSRCLQLPDDHWQKRGKGNSSCSYCGITKSAW